MNASHRCTERRSIWNWPPVDGRSIPRWLCRTSRRAGCRPISAPPAEFNRTASGRSDLRSASRGRRVAAAARTNSPVARIPRARWRQFARPDRRRRDSRHAWRRAASRRGPLSRNSPSCWESVGRRMPSSLSISATERSPSSKLQTIESRFGMANDLSSSLASSTLRHSRGAV